MIGHWLFMINIAIKYRGFRELTHVFRSSVDDLIVNAKIAKSVPH